MAGIALPQLAPASEDRVSGALSVDGSLRFDDDKKHNLTQTIGNGTNGFTLSFWMKPCQNGNRDELFDTVASTGFYIYRHTDGSIRINNNTAALFTSNGLYRDTSAFYNIVFSYKPVAGSTGYGLLYVNGKLDKGALFTTQLYAGTAKISSAASSDPADYYLSQWYLVDGLQLGPEYFGYTDPLTNTWRPKKFKAEGTTVNDGTDWSGNYSGSDPGDSFDGTNPSQNGYSHSASSLTITFPKPLSGRIIVYGGTGGGGADTYTLSDGSSLSTSQSYDSSPYFDALDFGEKSAITSLTCSAGYTLHGVSVDGVMLVDSTTQNLDFGSEGFYLPMDGSSPIGEDKSGKGNDWTPNNFGGSVALDSPAVSGARPILNTTQGGSQAGSGVFGSKVSATYVVSSSSGGGNPYIFTGADAGGTLTQPTFNFIRGATYTFDYSGADTHPLKFSTTENGTRAGGTEYTDGRVISSDVIKFTVPHNAPDTLYYYCANHTGMGNSISITTDETKADPYAWKNVIALPLVGANDDVSNQINVGSTTKVMTNGGNAAASSAQSNFYGGSFVFDNASDKVTSPNSTDYAFGTGDFTVECWYYMNNTSSAMVFAENWTSGTGWQLYHRSSDSKITWYVNSAAKLPSNNAGISNKWTHVAVCRTSGTTKIYLDGIENGSVSDTTDYSTSQVFCIGSQQSNDSNHMDGYLQDVRVYKGVAKYTSNFIPASTNPDILPDSPSGVATKSKLKKITDGAVSFPGSGQSNLIVPDHSDLDFGTGAFTIEGFMYMNSYGSTGSYPTLVSKYSTPGGSAGWIVRAKNDGKIVWYNSSSNTTSSSSPMTLRQWHHIAAVREGTGSNQMKVYVDGKLHITTTDDTDHSNNVGVAIGSQDTDNTNILDGTISNIRIIKGTALYTSEFRPPTAPLTTTSQGATSSEVKLLCCQSSTSAAEATVIPSGSITVNNNAIASNFNPFNTDINTVSGQEGGYCTWNPLFPTYATTSFSNGNLDSSIRYTNGSNTPYAVGTIAVSSGKWFWEITLTQESSDTEYIGFIDGSKTSGTWVFADIGAYFSDARKAISTTPSSYGATYTTGDVIGVELDADNGNITFYKNGVSQGAAATGMTGFDSYRPFTSANGTDTAQLVSANFGQKPFKFPPRDGFQPLTSSSLIPDNVIARPDKFVAATTYTGTGSLRDVNVGMQPDLVWIKRRDDTQSNILVDVLRGPTKELKSDGTGGESTFSRNVTAFNSNGFRVWDGNPNATDGDFITWTWKAGGAPTATNDNTSGAMDANSVSIDGVLQPAYTPSGSPSIYPKKMSIGTKQGFSIIQWTDENNVQTLPHGLSQAPDLILIKDLGSSVNWSVYHSGMGNAKAMYLNSTDGEFSTSRWNSTSPTANVFSWNDNTSTNDQIAYCWHDVPGLQKFGTYTGLDGADGPFIDLGFRPRMLLLKRYSSDHSNAGWHWYDTARDTVNQSYKFILADKDYVETRAANNTGNVSTYYIDILSNGFKLRHDSTNLSVSGQSYLYCAWADVPAFNLYGGQSNAR